MSVPNTEASRSLSADCNVDGKVVKVLKPFGVIARRGGGGNNERQRQPRPQRRNAATGAGSFSRILREADEPARNSRKRATHGLCIRALRADVCYYGTAPSPHARGNYPKLRSTIARAPALLPLPQCPQSEIRLVHAVESGWLAQALYTHPHCMQPRRATHTFAQQKPINILNRKGYISYKYSLRTWHTTKPPMPHAIVVPRVRARYLNSDL